MMQEDLPSKWKKAKVLSTILAAVMVPLIIGLIGHLVNQSIKNNELSLSYIRLAVGILKEEPKASTKNLRTWAIDVVNNYSEVKLSTDARNELRNVPLPLIESADSNPLTERVEYLNRQANRRNNPIGRPYVISQHTLLDSVGKPVSTIETQNLSGKITQHRLVVLHYTSTPTAEATVEWISNARAKASTHILIDRTGKVIQFVPFDYVAWHTGQSTWEDLTGLNNYSIGISLANAGKLERKGGSWISWTGEQYSDSEVYIHEDESGEITGWHKYTDIQLAKAAQIVKEIIDNYPIESVVGHSEITAGRKLDPGPAFPLDRFKRFVDSPNAQ